MSDEKISTNTTPAQDARRDWSDLPAARVAQGVGSFADDPADSRYQRAYLRELWEILREKMPK